MNTDEITKRIHARSDQALREKIRQSTQWVWDETGHSLPRPDESRFGELRGEINGCGIDFAQTPWIGTVWTLFKAVAFHYLRDKYRDAAVSEFMSKVESVQEIIDNQ